MSSVSSKRDSKSEAITKFIELKEKLAEMEKKYDKYRLYIEKDMEKNGENEIHHSIGNRSYTITKSLMKRESLAKKDVPPKIWEECHKTVMYTVIRIKENKGTKAKDDNDE
jgi:hypothetical protein